MSRYDAVTQLPGSPEAEQNLQAQAWQQMRDPAVIVDRQGVILASNDSFEALLPDRAPSSAQGLPRLAEALGDGPGPKIETRWLLETLEARGSVSGFDVSLTFPSGGSITLEGHACALSGAGARRYAMVWRDVSARSRHEQALSRRLKGLDASYARQTSELAQKVEALARANRELQELDQMRADFISLVSHQIRAPLTNMLGAVEAMQAGCASPTTICQRMFNVMGDQIARLTRLVKDVLSMTRLESGDLALHLEPVSVMSVLKQAVEQVGARGARAFHLPYLPVLPLVMADRDHVTEVVINLLDNADKYSPPGDDVRVEIRPTETEVVVSVLDSGPGLRVEDLERVFEKFYRAEAGDSQKAYGYGLGLYVCRLLTQAQGGRIWAANRPEGGAIFSLALSVARP